jgi:tetratricopeptide (TPR) repeat protein
MRWVESAAEARQSLDARRLASAEFHSLAGLVLHEVGEIGEAIPHLSEASRRWEEIAEAMGSLQITGGPSLMDEVLDQYEGLGGASDGSQLDDPQRVAMMEAWLQDRFVAGRHQVERARVVALGTAFGLGASEEAAHAWEARLEQSVTPPSRSFFLQGLWMDLGNVAQANGEFEAAANHFERARELVEPIDDQHRLQQLYIEFNRANALAQAGSDEAEASFAGLEQKFRELGDYSAALRCEHAQIYQAWRRGDQTAEQRLRENLYQQERMIGETQDAENLHRYKENLEKGYVVLLSILAQQTDRERDGRLREVLRLVAALREPAVLARLARFEEPGAARGIEAADALGERLRHLREAVLLIVESGDDGLVWIAVQGGEGALADRVAIEQVPVADAQALIDLLRRAEAESDAVSAGAISPTGTDGEALVVAAKQAWLSVPASIRDLVSSSDTVLYSPSAFGVVDQLPLELLHTGQSWLGLSHVIARFPSISHLERALAPNAAPRSLGRGAFVARAQDPADLGRLKAGDNDARRVHRALGILGLKSQLAFSPSSRDFLNACGGGNQVVHYVGHGLAGELGEALPLGNDEVTVAGLAELREHETPFVFLGACFVGRGRHLSGGKQRGIGFELLERGAPGVVAATYSVPDRVCSDVALAFYQHSLTHPVGEAMRRARQHLAEVQHLRAVCWSSFSLYGDPGIGLTAGAAQDLSGSRARTLDAPALLSRWMATGRPSDQQASLDAWTAWPGTSTELQEWLRASPRTAHPEQARGALVDGLVAEAPVHAAALRMLLAHERVTAGSLSGALSGEAATPRFGEIGLALSLSLQLDDNWAFAALTADYRQHCFEAADLGQSIAIMGKAEVVLQALSRNDEAFEEPLQATRALLEPLRSASMVMDARRMFGLSHEEFLAVEQAPGSELAKRALLKVMAQTGLDAHVDRAWWTAMMRYVATSSTEAYAELAASVSEHDRSHGGVSPREAELVRAVLVSYQGPGRIDAEALHALREQVAGPPEALRAVDVFEIHDRIASDPESVLDRDVAAGAALAEELGHAGLRTYFGEHEVGQRAEAEHIQSRLIHVDRGAGLRRLIDIGRRVEQGLDVLGPFYY